MADVRPGVETSEYKLTKWMVIAGAVITCIGAGLESLKSQNVDLGWLPIALTVCGMLGAVIKAMGYTAGRSTVKAAELTARGAVEVAQLLPFFRQVVELAQQVKQDGILGDNKPAAPPIIPPIR